MAKNNGATAAVEIPVNETVNVETPVVEATTEKVEETAATKPGAIKDGFVFGLVGASVKDGDGSDAKVIRREWTRKGIDFTVVNCEAPFPTNDSAAALAAADCETIIFKFEGDKIVQQKLKGLAAAVTIALQQNNEGVAAGVKSGKYPTEAAVRKVFSQKYGFSLPDAEAPTENDVRAAIEKAIAEGTDPIAAMLAVGIRMKLSSSEPVKL